MTPDEKYAYARSFPVHVGVDTGKKFHVLVVRGPDGKRRKAHKVKVSREGFEATDQYLTGLFPEIPREKMLVGLEFAGHHGFTFAHFLARKGYPIVNVLPAHTKKTKEIEDNSPLKTDAKDAALICKLVGDGTFVRFPFLESPFTELRLLTTQRHRLTVEANRFKNRLQGVLDLAWPEYVDFWYALDKVTPLKLLERWPLPQDLAAAAPRSVRAFIRSASRNHVDEEKLQKLLDTARNSVALTQAPEIRRFEIHQILERWALVRQQMKEIDQRLAELVEQCPAAKALTSLPEVSITCAAGIVAELGTPEDYEHPRQVLKLAGMNLIEKSSGMSRGRIRQSKRGRPMLRRQLFLLAGRWCLPRGLYRDYYLEMRLRNGGSKTKAVCAVARKMVPLLLAVMQSKEPFDLERWQAARHVKAAA